MGLLFRKTYNIEIDIPIIGATSAIADKQQSEWMALMASKLSHTSPGDETIKDCINDHSNAASGYWHARRHHAVSCHKENAHI